MPLNCCDYDLQQRANVYPRVSQLNGDKTWSLGPNYHLDHNQSYQKQGSTKTLWAA